MGAYRAVTSCRICGSSKLEKYLDLGSLPLANGLINSTDESADRFPLEVLLCLDCHLSQLSVVVDPKILYANYPYRSSVSTTFKRHCYDMGKVLKDEHEAQWKAGGHTGFDIEQPSLIDIGANDGCLINQFKRHGFKPIFAVEPDQETSKNISKEVFVVNNFWSMASMAPMQRLLSLPGASHITATNVFAHVDDIKDFLKTAKLFMRCGTTLVIEVPYAYHMILNTEFDTIYHEHLSYFLVKPLNRLFDESGMTLVDVTEHPIHGGTIRLFVKSGKLPQSKRVFELMDREAMSGLHDIKTYMAFSDSVKNIKNELKKLIGGLEGVVGFGASAKGCTLLNYCDIHLKEIWDDTPSKQGRYVPGVHTPIVPFDFHKMLDTTHILLLAWNFADEIMTKINNCGYRGKWIKPVPSVVVL